MPLIPKGKIVIWWMWGVDVYSSVRGLPPLIELSVFKPETEKVLKELRGGGGKIIREFIKEKTSQSAAKLQKRLIERIDFFQPVLPVEIKMMSTINGFRAREFYYPGSFSFFENPSNVVRRQPEGGIIIGHSQTPSANHLDAWNDVKDHIPEGRKVIIPINYLGDLDYAERLCDIIHSDRLNVLFLKEFLPMDDYYKLMNECSYAVYGMIRQLAMGNVYYCLKQGIKVFLYKDSIVYNFLKESGYVVFAIEDIGEDSFVTPLTEEENLLNTEALRREANYRNTISEQAIEEMLSMKKDIISTENNV